MLRYKVPVCCLSVRAWVLIVRLTLALRDRACVLSCVIVVPLLDRVISIVLVAMLVMRCGTSLLTVVLIVVLTLGLLKDLSVKLVLICVRRCVVTVLKVIVLLGVVLDLKVCVIVVIVLTVTLMVLRVTVSVLGNRFCMCCLQLCMCVVLVGDNVRILLLMCSVFDVNMILCGEFLLWRRWTWLLLTDRWQLSCIL